MTGVDEYVRTFVEEPPAGDEAERIAQDYARRRLQRALAVEKDAPTSSLGRLALRLRASQRRRRVLLAGSLAAALVVGAFVVIALLPAQRASDTSLGPGAASAAVVLEHAARAAARQPWHPLRAGEYDYQLSLAGPRRPLWVAELWVGADGTGQMVFPGPVSPQNPFQSQRFSRQHPFVWVEAGDYQQLIHLPISPPALKRWIDRQPELRGRSGRAAGSEEFTIVGDIMRLPAVPPALRAALFRVAERLPGVTLVGPTQDGLGRHGTAVGMTTIGSRGLRNDLIFDPTTGALLGERTVSLSGKSGTPAGSVINWSVYPVEAVVHTDHKLPAKAVRLAHRLHIKLKPSTRSH